MADDTAEPVGESAPHGIEDLRARLERRPRSVPPPRHPPLAAVEPAAATEHRPAKATPKAKPRRRTPGRAVDRPAPGPDEPLANLGVRVRRSLDEALVDLIHAMRKDGVRTSKAELVEMLLWELPTTPDAVRARLAAFRQHAPRETSL